MKSRKVLAAVVASNGVAAIRSACEAQTGTRDALGSARGIREASARHRRCFVAAKPSALSFHLLQSSGYPLPVHQPRAGPTLAQCAERHSGVKHPVIQRGSHAHVDHITIATSNSFFPANRWPECNSSPDRDRRRSLAPDFGLVLFGAGRI